MCIRDSSYTAFIHEDSLNAPHLDYLVYEQSISQYVVFGLADDSISVTKGEKEYEIRRQKKTATVSYTHLTLPTNSAGTGRTDSQSQPCRLRICPRPNYG